MGSDPRADAMASLASGPLTTLGTGALAVDIAPEAGGRIAQIRLDGVEQLVGHGDDSAAIAWGCYPMVPWAGRVRNGRFTSGGHRHQLPRNLGAHAIHGVGFTMPWRLQSTGADQAELSLALPQDDHWPFGGSSRQRIEVGDRHVRLTLSATAGDRAMPATIGWHPWFRKPDRVAFEPRMIYPRDADGIAVRPLVEPTPGPWDDCFINDLPVLIERGGQRVRLTSDCIHWVVYDGAAHATCVEPQSGPPDAFNLEPMLLASHTSVESWFLFEWL
ncbi:aldose epimerase [Lysobacter sp. S4-A87]|uniref:aldose epimerase family protein n=1 Tax=Lysobacter sp. S4-A87 TaxID=2925843 RepID=UPI001F52EBDE|nr:aldose epimerase [Lysobacter sp. S4-A87]UNK48761.1 aldose epimerase [Lysobacter sp. S4-A87]